MKIFITGGNHHPFLLFCRKLFIIAPRIQYPFYFCISKADPDMANGKYKTWRIFLIVFLLAIGIVGVLGYSKYKKVVAPNVTTAENFSLYITANADLESVTEQLKKANILKDETSFYWWATKKDLFKNLHPGRYVLKNGMSNREIVNLLMSGRQTPVNVTFNNIRIKKDFAGRIGAQIEADSIDFITYFDTTSYFKSLGLTKDNFMTLFIPNTYELYWNTSAESFIKRMQKEHETFWNSARLNKTKEIGLTPEEVYILASIVYSENDRASDEASRIAGVYMNRLHKGMKLEADPTVKFAIGDFAKKRIYFADLEIESPYNTYKYAGLPPGPIHMPPIKYIDAVLNYEKNDYIFLCGRGDGSGRHYFAETLSEHNKNRAMYIQTLNKLGIR